MRGIFVGVKGGLAPGYLTPFELHTEHGGRAFVLSDHTANKVCTANRAQSLEPKLANHLFMQRQQFGRH
jgi:hypothetical protein